MPSYTESAMSSKTPREKVERTAEQERVLAICLEVRESLEHEEYEETAGAYVNPELIMGAGVVTPPGQVRYSRAYGSMRAGRGRWSDVTVRDAHAPAETLSQIGTYGWAVSPFGDADTEQLALAAEQGVSTVMVQSADGELTIRPVSEYRKLRSDRKRAASGESDAEQALAEREARQAAQLDALSSAADRAALADGTA